MFENNGKGLADDNNSREEKFMRQVNANRVYNQADYSFGYLWGAGLEYTDKKHRKEKLKLR